jgi:hypothetical protein
MVYKQNMSLTLHAQPDKIYFDVVITNLQTIDTPPPTLYFNETRSVPFLQNPQDYYLSIIRFTLDTPTLPIFIPEIQPNQGNLNLTIYSVTLSWTDPVSGTKYSQLTYITYQTQDNSVPIPLPPNQNPNGLQNNTTGYYSIYNFQYWIYLINNAFTACFNDLNTQVVAAGLVLPTTNAPVMTFDTNNQVAIINCDVLGYNYTSSNYIQIFMNPALYQLFSSFPFTINGLGSSVTNNENVLIQTNTFGGANVIPFPPINPTYDAIQVIQEYSTIALWSPITSVVFCSNTLPIVPTNISAPSVYYNGLSINNNGNNSNVSQIITDFVSDTGFYKPNIVYNPSAQYRLVDMTGNRPVSNLDISVYWKDRIGTLQPFLIGTGTTATLKILFTRKGSIGTTKP